MRQYFFLFALCLVAVFCLTLQAQTDQNKFVAPFPFVVGDVTVPAGEYMIESTLNPNMLCVREVNGERKACSTVVDIHYSQARTEGKIVFVKQGNSYILKHFNPAGGHGHELVIIEK